jgi:hypothetical protein
MKKIISLLSCCTILICSYAQKNMQPGFVVLNNSDTVNGFIDYHEWHKNPANILFSTAKGKSTQRYGLQDISSFGIIGMETYMRYTVKISMDRKATGIFGEKDNSSITAVIFLKLLQQGKNLRLFSYADDVKKRLYILSTNETLPVELQHSEYISNGQLVNENQYRFILSGIRRRYMPEAENIEALINTQEYSQNNIVDICYRINGIDKKSVQQTEKNNASHFKFFAGVGVNQGKLVFGGNNHYTGKTNNSSYALVVNGGADIFINPAVGRMFMRTHLSFTSYKTTAYAFANYFDLKENYYLQFKQTNITLHEQLIYNLYNGPALKWFAGAGGGFNFSSYPLNEEKMIRETSSGTSTTINDQYILFLRKFWLNASVLTGVAIGNIEASVAYYPKGSISQNTGFGIDNSSLQLHVNYRF